MTELEPDPAADERPSSARRRRSWPQRLTISGLFLAAFAVFLAAAALYAGQRVIEDRQLVTIDNPEVAQADSGLVFTDVADDAGDDPERPVETFPLAEPDARNFLITGADNNSCIDDNSPYAAAFGDRSNFGERSDTIMMWRVNPGTSQVAVLSFPRDLWVSVADTSRKGRINEAYTRDEPQQLIDTIYQNFGITTDHYIQIDFCAFKTLVEAVDGVTVPFDRAVRDENTGLFVPSPGCFTFTGDHALAYVRSRYLEVYDEDSDTWDSDNAFDLGRISRQQDFIRRIVDELLAAGAFNPDVVRGLIETSTNYVVTDTELTPRKILEFAGVMRSVDPAEITTYQIEATSDKIQNQSVLVPRLNGDNMQAILAIFRGAATLTDAPEQVFDGAATATSAAVETGQTTAGSDSTAAPSSESTEEPVPFTTLPNVVADDIVFGYVPDPNATC
jgi:LCP family protein required for cell wall assembly